MPQRLDGPDLKVDVAHMRAAFDLIAERQALGTHAVTISEQPHLLGLELRGVDLVELEDRLGWRSVQVEGIVKQRPLLVKGLFRHGDKFL